MMRSLYPCLQVAEDEVDHRQVRLRLFWVAIERQRLVAVSSLGKSTVACPPVATDDSARCDVLFDKAGERFGVPVGYDTQSQATCIDAALMCLAVILTRPNFDGTDHGSLMVCTPAFPAGLAANVALVYFHRMLATDSVAFWTYHTGAELVEDLKGRLVASERELALELNGRLAGGLRGHKVSTPKPRREAGVARLHDGARRERRVGFATTAAKHHRRSARKTVWFTDEPAFRARKTIRPSDRLKVLRASVVIGEHLLKRWKGSREAACIHAAEYSILRLVCQPTG